MKFKITALTILLIAGVSHAQVKEKRIKFNQGTLKICTQSHMTIKGYDGDEVIIKSLNSSSLSYYYNFSDKDEMLLDSLEESSENNLQNTYYKVYSQYNNAALEKGLKPLGNKSVNPEDNLHLDIIEKPGELIINDFNHSQATNSNNSDYTGLYSMNKEYELLIPNSIKLLWNAEDCSKKNSNTFFVSTNSKPWELIDFDGETEISTSYNSISFTNVKGPVIANTIGGNITVIFDSIKPSQLYSLVSNDGYINVSLPLDAELKVDVKAKRILSDIDFKVSSETLLGDIKDMELQLNSGKTKMKIDAGSGSVYLRKHD